MSVNYYEHHLGDYMRDAAHLSLLEEGAYRRLIDAYYVREKELPSERKEVYKLARAAGAAERKAIDYVLATFFKLTEAGFWHKRCDGELKRFKTKSETAKASANARWSHSQRNANGMRTHSEGNANGMLSRLQTPVTSNQSPHTTPPDSNAATAARVCADNLDDYEPKTAWRPPPDDEDETHARV